MAKRRYTRNQLAWKKQEARLKRALSAIKREGFTDIEFQIPSMPKRVTKRDLARISRITRNDIRKTGVYYGAVGDEALTAYKMVKQWYKEDEAEEQKRKEAEEWERKRREKESQYDKYRQKVYGEAYDDFVEFNQEYGYTEASIEEVAEQIITEFKRWVISEMANKPNLFNKFIKAFDAYTTRYGTVQIAQAIANADETIWNYMPKYKDSTDAIEEYLMYLVSLMPNTKEYDLMKEAEKELDSFQMPHFEGETPPDWEFINA